MSSSFGGFGGFAPNAGGGGLPNPMVFRPPAGKTPLVIETVKEEKELPKEEFVLPEMDPEQLSRFNHFKATFERSLEKHTEMDENSRLKVLWMMFEDMPKEYQASFVREPKLREHTPTLAEQVAALEREVRTLEKK